MRAASLGKLDRAGGVMSMACAVHCAAAPVLLAALPAWAGSFFDERWETVYVVLALGLASFTHLRGFRRHGRWSVPALSAAAGLLLLAARLGGGPHERIMAAWGGLLLAAGHFLNGALCRACRSCQGEGEGWKRIEMREVTAQEVPGGVLEIKERVEAGGMTRKLMEKGLRVLLILTVLNQSFLGEMAEASLWSERRSVRAKRDAAPAARRWDPPAAGGPLVSDLLRSAPALARGLCAVALPENGKAERVVLHIQDIHLNKEAQDDIAGAIGALADGGRLDLVALEGAFGPIDADRFRSFPDRNLVRQLAGFLVKEGKVSGPVSAAMTGPAAFPPVAGVEDPALYEMNMSAYRRTLEERDELSARLAERRRRLETEKAAVFSRPLMAFDAAARSYEHGNASLPAHVRFLLEVRRVQAPALPAPALESFARALEKEKAFDLRKAEEERSALLREMAGALPREEMEALTGAALALSEGRMDQPAFCRALLDWARKAGLSPERFANFKAYEEAVLAAGAVDAAALRRDMASLEKGLYGVLARTAGERSLLARSRRLALEEKSAALSLTPEEWTEYQALAAGDEGPAPAAFEFYRVARLRDRALAENLIRAMDERGARTAVLVAGGFHAPGVEDRLKRAGIAVLCYVPRISDAGKAEAAPSVFRREKSPLERLAAGEALALMPVHPAQAGFDEAPGWAAAAQAPDLARAREAFLGLSSSGVRAGVERVWVEGTRKNAIIAGPKGRVHVSMDGEFQDGFQRIVPGWRTAAARRASPLAAAAATTLAAPAAAAPDREASVLAPWVEDSPPFFAEPAFLVTGATFLAGWALWRRRVSRTQGEKPLSPHDHDSHRDPHHEGHDHEHHDHDHHHQHEPHAHDHHDHEHHGGHEGEAAAEKPRSSVISTAAATAVLGLAFWGGWEIFQGAASALLAPAPVAGTGVLGVAILGLAVNLWALEMLAGSGDSHDPARRSLRAHLMGDVAGSLAAILSSLLILGTAWVFGRPWLWLDPALSLVAGFVLLRSAGSVALSLAAGRFHWLEAAAHRMENVGGRDVAAAVFSGVALAAGGWGWVSSSLFSFLPSPWGGGALLGVFLTGFAVFRRLLSLTDRREESALHHDHGHHGAVHLHGDPEGWKLPVAAGVTLLFAGFEFLGAEWFRSQALHADAWHMLKDAAAQLIVLSAFLLSRGKIPRFLRKWAAGLFGLAAFLAPTPSMAQSVEGWKSEFRAGLERSLERDPGCRAARALIANKDWNVTGAWLAPLLPELEGEARWVHDGTGAAGRFGWDATAHFTPLSLNWPLTVEAARGESRRMRGVLRDEEARVRKQFAHEFLLAAAAEQGLARHRRNEEELRKRLDALPEGWEQDLRPGNAAVLTGPGSEKRLENVLQGLAWRVELEEAADEAQAAEAARNRALKRLEALTGRRWAGTRMPRSISMSDMKMFAAPSRADGPAPDAPAAEDRRDPLSLSLLMGTESEGRGEVENFMSSYVTLDPFAFLPVPAPGLSTDLHFGLTWEEFRLSDRPTGFFAAMSVEGDVLGPVSAVVQAGREEKGWNVGAAFTFSIDLSPSWHFSSFVASPLDRTRGLGGKPFFEPGAWMTSQSLGWSPSKHAELELKTTRRHLPPEEGALYGGIVSRLSLGGSLDVGGAVSALGGSRAADVAALESVLASSAAGTPGTEEDARASVASLAAAHRAVERGRRYWDALMDLREGGVDVPPEALEAAGDRLKKASDALDELKRREDRGDGNGSDGVLPGEGGVDVPSEAPEAAGDRLKKASDAPDQLKRREDHGDGNGSDGALPAPPPSPNQWPGMPGSGGSSGFNSPKPRRRRTDAGRRRLSMKASHRRLLRRFGTPLPQALRSLSASIKEGVPVAALVVTPETLGSVATVLEAHRASGAVILLLTDETSGRAAAALAASSGTPAAVVDAASLLGENGVDPADLEAALLKGLSQPAVAASLSSASPRLWLGLPPGFFLTRDPAPGGWVARAVKVLCDAVAALPLSRRDWEAMERLARLAASHA